MSRWSFFSVCKYSSPFKTSLDKADIEESRTIHQTIRPQNDWYRSLVQTTCLHQVQRRAPTQILHDDPELGPLEIRTEVLGDVGRITLAEHHDLLLDVFDLILGLFQINNFDSNNLDWSYFYINSADDILLGPHLLSSVIDPLEDFPERSFPNSFLFCEDYLRIHFLNEENINI